jgi:hypothetical protein
MPKIALPELAIVFNVIMPGVIAYQLYHLLVTRD